MKLALNKESAQALRTLSAALKQAINRISQDSAKLLASGQALDYALGIHRQMFYDMLLEIKLAQDLATDAILALVPMMDNTAQKIENYLAWRNTLSKEQLIQLKDYISKNGPAALSALGFNDSETGNSPERGRKLIL